MRGQGLRGGGAQQAWRWRTRVRRGMGGAGMTRAQTFVGARALRHGRAHTGTHAWAPTQGHGRRGAHRPVRRSGPPGSARAHARGTCSWGTSEGGGHLRLLDAGLLVVVRLPPSPHPSRSTRYAPGAQACTHALTQRMRACLPRCASAPGHQPPHQGISDQGIEQNSGDGEQVRPVGAGRLDRGLDQWAQVRLVGAGRSGRHL